MSYDEQEMFKIVLDRLIQAESERAKTQGFAEALQRSDNISAVVTKEVQRLVDESRRLQRLINERQDLSSVNALLKELRGAVVNPDIHERIDAAIELTDPIPF